MAEGRNANMKRERRPMTNYELEGKYRKSAFFINRGMTRIFRIEEVMTAMANRMEAGEQVLEYLLRSDDEETVAQKALFQDLVLMFIDVHKSK